jgi:glycerol-3-phosphate acyltransferase PlsX
MRVAVDVMGGDLGPRVIAGGAIDGLKYLDSSDELVLFGPEDEVAEILRELQVDDPRVRVHHCSQVIGMEESPVEGVRHKRDSTIVRMARAAGKGEVEAIISAGNTGAFAAACQFFIKPLPGVTRPGIGVVIPTFHGPVLLCDAGANVAPKPRHLYEYASMGASYARRLLNKENPRIGLASIGEEESKGNPLVREAAAMIKADPALTFVGNVEGRDMFEGRCDVFVSDGFTGNIVLKLTEGLAEGLFKTIVRELKAESEELAEKFEPIVERIWRNHDFKEYGGAPLLGLNSLAIICHGRSDERAIANAIRVAAEESRVKLNEAIVNNVSSEVSEASGENQ